MKTPTPNSASSPCSSSSTIAVRRARAFSLKPKLIAEARRGLQPRRLRFVPLLKPTARHKTFQTGLQIPSGYARAEPQGGRVDPGTGLEARRHGGIHAHWYPPRNGATACGSVRGRCRWALMPSRTLPMSSRSQA